MILDKLLEFDPAGTAVTATAASTNIIDLHGANLIPAFSATVKPGRDMGGGSAGGPTPMLLVVVTTTFTAGGAGTLNVQFQAAPDNGSGAAGSFVTYAESGVQALANLVAGNTIFNIDVPRILPLPNTPALLPRFLQLNYVVATGPMTAGKLSAYIVLTSEPTGYYLPGFTVPN